MCFAICPFSKPKHTCSMPVHRLQTNDRLPICYYIYKDSILSRTTSMIHVLYISPSTNRKSSLFAARTGVASWHNFPAPRGNGNGPPHIPTHPRTPLACDIRLHTPNYRCGTPVGVRVKYRGQDTRRFAMGVAPLGRPPA